MPRAAGSDLSLQAKEVLRIRAQMESILSRHTGRTVAELRRDTDRDRILEAQEAVDYGLADLIVTSRKAVAVG